MEDTLISIDSKYRDTTKYPNESKFTINLEKTYKNIVSIKMVSLEITNTLNYVSSSKGNNYITLHFPNITNDPVGVKITLDNTQLQDISKIQTAFNTLITTSILNNSKERYFYIFYLNSDTTITFDFNSSSSPSTLSTPLTITSGWYSVYGLVILIQNYIQTSYNNRIAYVNANLNVTPINLDSGKFTINTFTLNIFDRRSVNNIRSDVFTQHAYTSTLSNNLQSFKNDLYSFYITDTTNFTPVSTNTGILDVLLLNYTSIYYINSTNTSPGINNNMLYSISMSTNTDTLRVSFNNVYNNYYYTTNNWSTIILFDTSNISSKDIYQFQIDFNTQGNTSSSFTNGVININNFTYPSIGYYLGYRSLNNSFILSPTLSGTSLILSSTKNYNTTGDDYIFLRINDWGIFDFFNKILFSKIFLRSSNTTPISYINKVNVYTNKEYVFRQLTNISRLDIELVDYLGNTVDLNGVDFSFTLSLRTQVSVGQKQLLGLQNSGIY